MGEKYTVIFLPFLCAIIIIRIHLIINTWSIFWPIIFRVSSGVDLLCSHPNACPHITSHVLKLCCNTIIVYPNLLNLYLFFTESKKLINQFKGRTKLSIIDPKEIISLFLTSILYILQIDIIFFTEILILLLIPKIPEKIYINKIEKNRFIPKQKLFKSIILYISSKIIYINQDHKIIMGSKEIKSDEKFVNLFKYYFNFIGVTENGVMYYFDSYDCSFICKIPFYCGVISIFHYVNDTIVLDEYYRIWMMHSSRNMEFTFLRIELPRGCLVSKVQVGTLYHENAVLFEKDKKLHIATHLSLSRKIISTLLEEDESLRIIDICTSPDFQLALGYFQSSNNEEKNKFFISCLKYQRKPGFIMVDSDLEFTELYYDDFHSSSSGYIWLIDSFRCLWYISLKKSYYCSENQTVTPVQVSNFAIIRKNEHFFVDYYGKIWVYNRENNYLEEESNGFITIHAEGTPFKKSARK